MQYILNEEEMEEIRNLRRALWDLPGRDLKEFIKTVNHVCQTIATQYAYIGESPYGCIHSKDDRAYYCDGCPMDAICMLTKEYSK